LADACCNTHLGHAVLDRRRDLLGDLPVCLTLGVAGLRDEVVATTAHLSGPGIGGTTACGASLSARIGLSGTASAHCWRSASLSTCTHQVRSCSYMPAAARAACS